MTGLHSVRQIVWHLRARDPLAAPAFLTASEAALFHRMPPADQLEGLAVSRTLMEWGYSQDRELLVAGTLHDVGKSLAPAFVGYRVAMTALSVVPGVLPVLSRLFTTVRLLDEHASNGALMAARAGLPADIVRLIGKHHSSSNEPRLMALQRADSLH